MCDGSGLGDPLRLERHIYVRRHGDGFTVSVEPHPVGDSLNRRCGTYAAAMAWARGTHERKGWQIINEAEAAQAFPRDQQPEYGRGKVRIEAQDDGSWIVWVSPRPWSWEDVTKQFYSFKRADAYADELRHRIKIDELYRQQRSARNKGSR